jgi:hypothetical protein
MKVFKVVYYERKIFVIVDNTEGDLRSIVKETKEEVKDNKIAISS